MTPRKGGILAILALAMAGVLGMVLDSCATTPATSSSQGQAKTTGGGSQTGGGGSAPAGSGGTTIQTIPSTTPTKAQAERKAIVESIAFGSPTSLTQAFALIGSVTALDRTEARLLAWVGARVATIVYPLRSPSFVPQDLQNQGEIPTGALARMVSEALSGRVPDLPKESAGDPLAEIIPALAVFRSDSRETARLALVALDRFDLLGPPSVIPSIVRGLDAERRKAWSESLANYLKGVGIAADAWPAVIGAARARLALGQSAEALTLIATAPDEIANDSDFRKVKASALYENGAFTDADPLVAQALRDDPLDSTLMLERAHLLVRAKSWQQALPLLDAYSIVDSTSRQYILLRALSSEGLRSREDALRWAKKGLGAFPDDPEFLTITARMLFSQPASSPDEKAATMDEARKDARRSFDLTADPAAEPAGLSPARLAGRAEAGNEAARLLFEDAAARFDWVGAVPYIERARKAPGFSNEALVGLALRRAGDWAQALDHATLWYRDNPNSEAAAEAYLRALLGSGNTKAADDLLPRLLLGPGTTAGRSNLHYLQSLLPRGEEAALAALRTSLVENADNVEALLGMYDIYFRRQDYQRARFYLKQALALAPSDPEIIRRSRELGAISP
jgi:tetratricopeptide (TPR) repeat protein